MKFSQAIKPISHFKAHAVDVIRELNEHHGTMIITQHGEAKAFIQDITEYQRIQEALALLKMVAQGQKDFEEGKTIPDKKLFKEFDDMISKNFPKKYGGSVYAKIQVLKVLIYMVERDTVLLLH